MTLLYRDRPKIRIGIDELKGAMNLLSAEVDERGESGDLSTSYYVGAKAALTVLFHQEHIEYPNEFLRLFERELEEITLDGVGDEQEG